jgi:inositol 1,4,5-triphosphate receptor type 1
VLVDILYRPELLFPAGTEARRKCENGGFIKRLITHTSKLLEEKQDFLCVKILQTLREMMATETDCGEKGEQLRLGLLLRYFNKVPLPAMHCGPAGSLPVSHGPGAKFLIRAQMNLHFVQCHLDNQGASTLIVDLVIKSATNVKIFTEVIELGIALLEGGNQDIQKTLFSHLHSGATSQNFFKVFYEKMNEAQMEIKSTVTVNTADITAKANEDKEPTAKEILEKAQKKKAAKPVSNGVIITEELREELDTAAVSTQQAISAVKGEALTIDDPYNGGAPTLTNTFEDLLAEKVDRAKEKEEETKLSPKVSIMQPILRFLQLLCENHNRLVLTIYVVGISDF